MKNDFKTEIEDILSQEKVSKESVEKELQNSEEYKSQNIAIQIFNFLRIPKYSFKTSTKEKLKHEIKLSVKQYHRKRTINRWSSAAAILIIGLVGSFFYYQYLQSDLLKYAKNLDNLKPERETKLLLQGGEEVIIKKQESTIKYEKSGANINIGQEKEIVQKIDAKQPVYNTVVVPYGKRSRITLADGSSVWLNSGSKLIYPAVFTNNKREVYLEGEAIFNVTHNEEAPFTVSSRDFNIKVLGTIFNISAYPDDKYSSAVLKNGKIALKSNSKSILKHNSINMSPGEMATYDFESDQFIERKVNPNDYMSWRKGYYIFKSEELANILKKISRYYNVRIVNKQTAYSVETFSGSLDFKSDPEEVLSYISKTIPIKYVCEKDKIIIY